MPQAHQILERLQKLAAKDNRPTTPIEESKGSAVSTFVTHERERIAGVSFPLTSIVVVVEGAKELMTMGRQLRFPAGNVLVLPGGWRGDVVNDPDAATGVYRAIFLDFPDELVARATRSFPPGTTACGPRQLNVALDSVLAAAIHHAGEGIATGNLPPMLIEHRLMEVLMVLGVRGALPLRAETTGEAVRALIRWQPGRPWTADLIAAELGTSNATLRRRLAQEDLSLRDILAAERAALAETMLNEDGLSFREAALANGYRSPRRFAERMRAVRDSSGNLASN